MSVQHPHHHVNKYVQTLLGVIDALALMAIYWDLITTLVMVRLHIYTYHIHTTCTSVKHDFFLKPNKVVTYMFDLSFIVIIKTAIQSIRNPVRPCSSWCSLEFHGYKYMKITGRKYPDHPVQSCKHSSVNQMTACNGIFLTFQTHYMYVHL